MIEITPDYARQLLGYDPNTGAFIWKERVLRSEYEPIDKGWNKRFAGKKVASRRHRHGHLQIGLHCRNYMAHRLAWMIYYGTIPDKDIDHINGDPADNRIANLRLVTPSENLSNAKIRTDNSSGIKGVSWSKKHKKWYAYINKHKKMIPLGLFQVKEDAFAARKIAEEKYHGEFRRST